MKLKVEDRDELALVSLDSCSRAFDSSVELTIKKIINGLDVENKNTLINPDCLKEFENIYKEMKIN